MNLFKHNIKAILSLTLGSFLLSCAYVPAQVRKEKNTPTVEPETTTVESMPKQLGNIVKTGLKLDMSTFVVSIPSKVDDIYNVLDFSNAFAKIRIDELSLHGIEAEIGASLDYNGVNKDVDFLMVDEELYFSLTDPIKKDGFRFKTSIEQKDDEGTEVDPTTRGIVYYEYGSLDYFIYSVFESFDIPSIDLDLGKNGDSVAIDFDAIVEATRNIEEINAHSFKLDLPIGEETLSIGLHSNSKGTLDQISFPYGGGEYEFSNGLKVSFIGNVSSFSEAFTLPFEENEYLNLEDSLELVKEIGSKISNKKFGIEANLAITHKEDEVKGDIDVFSREEIKENATLSATADVDLTSSYHDVTAGLVLSSNSKTESIDLHINDNEGKARCYFDFNFGILKGYSSVSVFSSLWGALSSLFGDEEIQNNEIMDLLKGLLATSDSISAAIEGIKTSAIGVAIEEGHFESIISAITNIHHANNRIEVELDLTKAGGVGTAEIVLDSTTENLVEVTLNNAGIVTETTPTLSLLLTGSVLVRDYQEHSFDGSFYSEYRHLPSLATSLEKFADSKQLSANLQGYMRNKGTSAVTNYTIPSWTGNSTLREQGFTFSGQLGLDLKEKTGAGKITFVDRKENYFNDHNLLLDITGPEGDNDSDEKDFSGNSGDLNKTGYMLVQYDSRNANTNVSAEKRTQPESDPLKGRFTIHSLDQVLKMVAELLSSTDPRFKRLTNLFNGIMNESIIASIIDGRYLEALANGFFASSSIDSNGITLVAKNGLVYAGYDLKIRVKFGEDYQNEEGVMQPGKIKTLEILSESPSVNEGTDIYAKIDIHSASFPNSDIGFNFINKNSSGSYSWKSGYSLSAFNSYSSIANLVDNLIGTMTLGSVDDDTPTTYHLHFSIGVSAKLFGFSIGLLSTTIEGDVFIFLHKTNVKILATFHYGDITMVISEDSWVNIFYETNGDDSAGTLYITRSVKTSEKTTTRKVTGTNFISNITKWLVYIFNFSSTIKNAINDSSDNDSSKALHGEDLIKGFRTEGSYASPVWKLLLNLKSILPDSFSFMSFSTNPEITISGKTVTGQKNKSWRVLSNLSTTLSLQIIKIATITATVNAYVANVSSGTYVDGWNTGSTCAYYITAEKKLFGYNYILHTDQSGTPEHVFSNYGMSSSDYVKTPYYIDPDTRA